MARTLKPRIEESSPPEPSQPNYYIVIPGDIIEHPCFTWSIKVLYGVISGLCNSKGFCWAKDEYLADRMDVEERTVRTWIGILEGFSFIEVGHAIYGKGLRRITLFQGADGVERGEWRGPGDPPAPINRKRPIAIPPMPSSPGPDQSHFDPDKTVDDDGNIDATAAESEASASAESNDPNRIQASNLDSPIRIQESNLDSRIRIQESKLDSPIHENGSVNPALTTVNNLHGTQSSRNAEIVESSSPDPMPVRGSLQDGSDAESSDPADAVPSPDQPEVIMESQMIDVITDPAMITESGEMTLFNMEASPVPVKAKPTLPVKAKPTLPVKAKKQPARRPPSDVIDAAAATGLADAPEASKPNATKIFIDALKAFSHPVPDFLVQDHTLLAKRLKDDGEEKFRKECAGFAQDRWAISLGHTVSLFRGQSPTRWIMSNTHQPDGRPVGQSKDSGYIKVDDLEAHLAALDEESERDAAELRAARLRMEQAMPPTPVPAGMRPYPATRGAHSRLGDFIGSLPKQPQMAAATATIAATEHDYDQSDFDTL